MSSQYHENSIIRYTGKFGRDRGAHTNVSNRSRRHQEPFSTKGEGFLKLVPVLGGVGTKTALLGNIFDQSPTERSSV